MATTSRTHRRVGDGMAGVVEHDPGAPLVLRFERAEVEATAGAGLGGQHGGDPVAVGGMRGGSRGDALELVEERHRARIVA